MYTFSESVLRLRYSATPHNLCYASTFTPKKKLALITLPSLNNNFMEAKKASKIQFRTIFFRLFIWESCQKWNEAKIFMLFFLSDKMVWYEYFMGFVSHQKQCRKFCFREDGLKSSFLQSFHSDDIFSIISNNGFICIPKFQNAASRET